MDGPTELRSEITTLEIVLPTTPSSPYDLPATAPETLWPSAAWSTTSNRAQSPTTRTSLRAPPRQVRLPMPSSSSHGFQATFPTRAKYSSATMDSIRHARGANAARPSADGRSFSGTFSKLIPWRAPGVGKNCVSWRSSPLRAALPAQNVNRNPPSPTARAASRTLPSSAGLLDTFISGWHTWWGWIEIPIPIPYDFDFSGIVDTRYATPDVSLDIRRARQRQYRGICRPREEIDATLQVFQEKKEAIYSLYREQDGLEERTLERTIDYLDEFFEVIEDSGKVRGRIERDCRRT